MKASSVVLKAISTLLFLSILTAVILIVQNPSTGYELSIYDAVPTTIWVLLVLPIIGGISIVVYEASRSEKNGNRWLLGLLLILLSNLVILLLPALRDYAFSGNQDHLTHFGMVRDILQFGHFGADNIYPITHVLISQLCLILNVSPATMMSFISPFFYLLFVLFTYALCQEILPRKAAILATVSSTVLFAYYYVRVIPFGFAAIMLPLVFFLLFKSRSTQSVSLRLLVIVLIILTVFFHALTVMILILSLVVMTLSQPLLDRLFLHQKKENTPSMALRGQNTLILAAIGFVTLMLWAWNAEGFWSSVVLGFRDWLWNLRSVGDIRSQSAASFATEGWAKLGLGPLEIAEWLIRWGGHLFVYSILSLVAIITLMRRKTLLSPGRRQIMLMFSAAFCLVAFFGLVDIIRAITILHSSRIMHYMYLFFPPLVGLALYQIASRENDDKKLNRSPRPKFQKGTLMRRIVTILVITICSLLGIFSVYPSPLLYQPNLQVTHMSLAGASWYFKKADSEIEVTGIERPITLHYKRALFGYEGAKEIHYRKWGEEPLIDHFGYPQHQNLGESFTEAKYLLLTERDRLTYTVLYPQIGRFTQDDFNKLEEDTSSSKLYTNGEMDFWCIHGQG